MGSTWRVGPRVALFFIAVVTWSTSSAYMRMNFTFVRTGNVPPPFVRLLACSITAKLWVDFHKVRKYVDYGPRLNCLNCRGDREHILDIVNIVILSSLQLYSKLQFAESISYNQWTGLNMSSSIATTTTSIDGTLDSLRCIDHVLCVWHIFHLCCWT